MNGNNRVKEIKIIVRGLLVNSPVKMKVDILPVETWDYQSCIKEIEFFVASLISYADISLTIRLAREILKRLPSMFPPDIDKLIGELEEKIKEKRNGNGSRSE